MKIKTKKLLTVLLAFTMVISLFAAMPLAASAEDGPIEVTMNPVGAIYVLNQTAIPLKATFYYSGGGTEPPDSNSPIKVQWYWSLTNTNTGRDNGQGEYVRDNWLAERPFEYQTTLTPTTDTVGVRYYYAVLEYMVRIQTPDYSVKYEKREAVTAPAKVEVNAPDQPVEQSFQVRKVDDKGNPLAGAVFALVPDQAYTWGEKKSYEATSGTNGSATFTVTEGAYILSEKQAPSGYIASDETHSIWVDADGVMEVVDYRTQNYKPYETIVFVNNPTLESSFRVRKVDENGNPLAGAVFALVPDPVHGWGEKKSYEATSASNGYASFTVADGAYILSEKRAPAGYNASDETYLIWVQEGQILEVIDIRTQRFETYETIVFVNKPIPTLKKDDHFAYMVGYPEGDFRPSRNMTRAEAVVMFSRLLEEGIKLDGDYINDHYPDLPPTAWYANAVCYMQSLGVLTDYSRDANFRPNEPVTRAEFATLATHFDEITLTDTNIFADVPNDHWAVKYINSAAAKGWIVGYDEGGVKNFKPEGNITRAEVVTLVNRMLERKGDGAYLAANLSSLPRTFSDLAPAHWAYLDIMESAIGHDYIKSGGVESWTGVYE